MKHKVPQNRHCNKVIIFNRVWDTVRISWVSRLTRLYDASSSALMHDINYRNQHKNGLIRANNKIWLGLAEFLHNYRTKDVSIVAPCRSRSKNQSSRWDILENF